jgi:hypothetical protein
MIPMTSPKVAALRPPAWTTHDRATSVVRDAYSTLKQRLATDYPTSPDDVAGKSDFISHILTTQGLNTDDIAAIHQSNQALFNA